MVTVRLPVGLLAGRRPGALPRPVLPRRGRAARSGRAPPPARVRRAAAPSARSCRCRWRRLRPGPRAGRRRVRLRPGSGRQRAAQRRARRLGLGLVVARLEHRPTGAARPVADGRRSSRSSAPSLVGHTRAFAPGAAPRRRRRPAPDRGRLWLGGLVGLVLALRALAGREALAAETLSRFSTLAGFPLSSSPPGTFLAWRILGRGRRSSRPVRPAPPGQDRIALVVAGIGGWNRWRALPRVGRRGFADRERAAARGRPHRAGRGRPARGAARRDRLPRQPVTTPGAGHGRVRADRRPGRHRRRPPGVRGVYPRRTGSNTLCPGAGRSGRALRPAAPPRRRDAHRRPRHRRSHDAPAAPAPIARSCSARGRVGGAGQHPAEPLREPGDDGQADGATVTPTGTVCRKPSTRTCAKRR